MPELSTEDLLTPSLQDEVSVTDWAPPPFRLENLLYTAFFGGPLAVGVLAAIQAGRLRQGNARVWGLLALALVGAAGVGLSATLLSHVESLADLGTNMLFRRANNAWGLLLWLALKRMLSGPDLRYAVRYPSTADEPRSSLWVPGLLAIIVLGSIQQIALRMALLPFVPMESGP